ncbi:hypothetical protein WA1_14905 [Scytonema hofmannii PCC 7110]|jgi:hypothetical protein|uniref:Uncharacterized protein n=1 Tax=Scytonema hofmannii PCC 7110 TaxID=128403 RepID=A0A139XD63_9CYAN|nr:hypothetical protein [Scytonema hofmannii]KYC42634.1 hypothetical protein WA1_14905 [Scytonema hofmannii PCC 7110]
MQRVLSISVEEKERLFHTELVKHGVSYSDAARVAKILASEKPDELLTGEEIQLTTEACKIWLKQHKRLTSLIKYTCWS